MHKVNQAEKTFVAKGLFLKLPYLSCDIPLDLSNYWVPQMYVKKKRDNKFYFLDNYMAIYYKLLNNRGGMHPTNNPINPGDFHSFPPGFR